MSIIVSSKDDDENSMAKYKKIKKILGISDDQLSEFANFKKNEKKLLQKLGSFIEHEIETGKAKNTYTALNYIQHVYQEQDDVNEQSKSDKKVRELLGITTSNLEAYRSYQKKMPKLQKVLGQFIQLDNPREMKKIDELESAILVAAEDDDGN